VTTVDRPARPGPECTGISATWCPVHGDCQCPVEPNGERWLDDDGCPLHAATSLHAEPSEAQLIVVDRKGEMHDPLKVAEWLDSHGDRSNEAVGESLHDAADVMRRLVELAK
jgi:hypothetical protein